MRRDQTATLLAMRLAGLQARLDELTDRVRQHPTHSPKLYAEIWRTCLAHEKTVRALADMPAARADLARGTGDYIRLPRARVPRGARPRGKGTHPPRSFPSCWSGH